MEIGIKENGLTTGEKGKENRKKENQFTLVILKMIVNMGMVLLPKMVIKNKSNMKMVNVLIKVMKL